MNTKSHGYVFTGTTDEGYRQLIVLDTETRMIREKVSGPFGNESIRRYPAEWVQFGNVVKMMTAAGYHFEGLGDITPVPR